MRIAPVNYTNQKTQKNDTNFGMTFQPKELAKLFRRVHQKGAAYQSFTDEVGESAARLGAMNHRGRQIIATIKEGFFGRFTVYAKCGNRTGRSDRFKIASGNTPEAGKESARRFILAAEQAAQNSNPNTNFDKATEDAICCNDAMYARDDAAQNRIK